MDSWERIDTKNNKIWLKINIDNTLSNKWEENEYEMRQDGFYKYNDDDNLNYLIKKDDEDEEEGIKEFIKKCKKWEINQDIKNNNDIKIKNYLTIDEDIDFLNFCFIKDDYFNEDWNNYLFIYKKNEDEKKGVKLSNINIDVEIDNYDNKYIEISEDNENFDIFMKKLENRIITCKEENNDKFNIQENYEYNYYKNNSGNYKFKIKKDNIEVKQYNNATVYINFNKLWNMGKIEKWGVSLTVDKIYEN